MDAKLLITDNVHGTIIFEGLIRKIIDLPYFQRLRRIRQLENMNRHFPSANHSRFEHSLGTAHIAGLFCDYLRTSQPELNITDADVLCVKIAGLCHDLGHGPFSHLFEIAIARLHTSRKQQLGILFKVKVNGFYVCFF